jgi:hypothetical protein
MTACEKTQTVAEFRANPDAALDGLNDSGTTELVSADGEVKAILMSPALFMEMSRQIDEAHWASMRKAAAEIAEGKEGTDAFSFLDELRGKLLARKAEQNGVGK